MSFQVHEEAFYYLFICFSSGSSWCLQISSRSHGSCLQVTMLLIIFIFLFRSQHLIHLVISYVRMASSFSYWDDCVEPQDLEAMWNVPEVTAEWFKAGEARCQKVHLSRDPDGQPYLTQIEMRVKYTTLP